MKKLFKTFVAVALIGGLATFSSCTKTCDSGYEGDKCNTEIRAKFVGQWQGNESCTVGSDTYTLTIANASDILKITLNNVYGQAFVATATVEGTTFTVANQNVGGTVNVQGNGSLSGSVLTFTYTINDGVSSNSCTFTGNKL